MMFLGNGQDEGGRVLAINTSMQQHTGWLLFTVRKPHMVAVQRKGESLGEEPDSFM